MIANRRERWLLILAGAGIGGLVLNSLWLDPLLASLDRSGKRLAAADDRLEKVRKDIRRKPALEAKLREVEARIARSAVEGATAAFDRHVSDLASQAGARQQKVTPEKREKVDVYDQVLCRTDLTPGIGALQKYLWLLDTSPLPLKIAQVAIARSRDDSDDLTVHASLSTLTGDPARLPGAALGSAPPPAPPARELAHYDVIRIRNPFSPKPPRKDPPPAPKVETAPAAPAKRVPKLNCRFAGTMQAADGRAGPAGRVAVVEREGRPVLTLAAGDAFLGGKVAEVERNRLVVEVGAEKRTFQPDERFSDGETVEEGKAAETPSASGSGGGEAAPAAGSGPALLTDEEKNLPEDEKKKRIMEKLRDRKSVV